MANPNFGTYVPVNSPDPDWITGWGKRPYNWQTSVNVDRELMPNLVVNAGYFRTWYGNFMVTDNQRVTPADYSPYCVDRAGRSAAAAERPAALRALRHQPQRFGQVDNLITREQRTTAKQEEVYNGVDVNFQLRAARRAPRSAAAGTSATPCSSAPTAGGSASAGTDTCYVIDSPQQLFNCEVDVPYQNRIKLNGSYMFP